MVRSRTRTRVRTRPVIRARQAHDEDVEFDVDVDALSDAEFMYGMYGWMPHVSAAARRARATRAMATLQKKGKSTSPVVIEGRTIARTFWGKAWCDNLERYSDFANRLPRGRTYVRSGSVLDLQIAPGVVTAVVSGTRVYRTTVKVAAVPKARWEAICHECGGAIDSLVELLQGRLSNAVMERLCREQTGLFPAPSEIELACSCPDWALMCKHVAAVLYGIGARLDQHPELLFTLRKVEASQLIAGAGERLSRAGGVPARAKVLEGGDLAEMFGIEMAAVDAAGEARAKAKPKAKSGGASKAAASTPRAKAKPGPKPTARRKPTPR